MQKAVNSINNLHASKPCEAIHSQMGSTTIITTKRKSKSKSQKEAHFFNDSPTPFIFLITQWTTTQGFTTTKSEKN